MSIVQETRKISSHWEVESGNWSDVTCTYVNRKTDIHEEVIKMGIDSSNKRKLLKFYGGPTGYESYYIDSLKKSLSQHNCNELCICAGTINGYAACYVKASDVLQFLRECS